MTKRRHLFAIDREAFEQRPRYNHRCRILRVGPNVEPPVDLDLDRLSPDPARWRARLGRPDCTLFVAIDADTGKPAGSYWSLRPTCEPVWHDKFRVDPGEALLFNAFVEPRFRQRGIYRELQEYAHRFLFEHTDCQVAYTIVEAENKASVRANEAFGLSHVGVNVLVKARGRNVLSVYWGGPKRGIYWVFRNRRGWSL